MTDEAPPWSIVLARNELELEADWARLAALWFRRFGREPTVESALFMAGLHARGEAPHELPRDLKQDVIMEGTFHVLATVGVYRRSETDGSWERTAGLPVLTTSDQERLLRAGLVRYFASVLSEAD